MLDILKKAKENKFANGETVSYNTNNASVANEKIKLNDGFEYGDTATIQVVGGVLDGTVCTFSASDEVTANYKLNGDQLTISINNYLLTPRQVDIYYSLDDGEYKKYTDSVTVAAGEHNLKVKFFNKQLINENINVDVSACAIRSNGKVYLYTDSSDEMKYSLTGDNFIEYTESFENSDSKTVFVKIGDNEVKEIEIIEKNKINDVDTKTGIFGKVVRENGQIIVTLGDVESSDKIYYSFNRNSWTQVQLANIQYEYEAKMATFTINNIYADTIYIRKTNSAGTNANVYCYNIVNNDNGTFSGVIGTYNKNGKGFIFGQDRAYSVYDYVQGEDTKHQYTIIDEDIDIQKYSDDKIIDITTIMGDTFILKEDGIVYKMLDSYDDLQAVTGGMNFVQIDGIFALDNNNKIWRCNYNSSDGTYSYEMRNYDIYGKIEKLTCLESTPYVLYASGTASQVYSFGSGLVTKNAIDIATDGEDFYALKYNEVLYNSMTGSNLGTNIDISFIRDNGEVPIRINKKGSILTDKGNVYEIKFTYSDDISSKLTNNVSSDNVKLNSDIEKTHKIYEVTNIEYLQTPSQTGVVSFGDYSYEDENGNIYYENKEKNMNFDDFSYSMNVKEVKAYNETDSRITITKDESKLNENKVLINVEVPENTYTIKKPDGKTTNEKNCTYEVTENGEYVFEFTNSNGESQIRVIHVTTIQNRKETKVPEVTALNGKIKLESDEKIEYSVDNGNWQEYTEEIEYKEPIYARVVSDKYECSILKITMKNGTELNVENIESREVQPEILTNSLGSGYNETINWNKKVEEKGNTTENQKKNFFSYISEIADNIIYSFSSTDGKFAGCYFENNVTDLIYKDMENSVQGINGENYNLQNSSNIEYSVVNRETKEILQETTTEEEEKQKVENGEIISYEEFIKSEGHDIYYWKETYVKYAYIDSNGKLISNYDVINKAKEEIEQRNENVKYTKIVGDGTIFYILTEEGEVYFIASADNGTWYYLFNKLNLNIDIESFGKMNEEHGFIVKLDVRNIVNIYDSCTALTKDGKMISLIKDNEEDTAIVQEMQKQTDKYLVSSHLGLKNGKLYNFDDVKQGAQVTSGEIVLSDEAKYGVYSQEENKISLFSDEYVATHIELKEGEQFIDVKATNENLPEFVDIAEHRDSALTMFVSRYEGDKINGERKKILVDYSDTDKYALCYAIAKDGEIWTYIGGYIIDTGMNLDFFGPTANYTLNNTNWTNKDINLNFTENTTNKITIRKINKDNENIAESNSATITKNGTYSIEIADSKGRSNKTTLKVKNIDKINPVVESTGKIVNGNLNVTAYDVEDSSGDYAKSDIAAIEITYDNQTENANWTRVETSKDDKGNTIAKISELQSGKKLYIRAIDNAGNISKTKEVEIPNEPEPETETGKVIVKYQDTEGNKIKEDTSITGEVGESYKTERADIYKYKLVEVVGSEEGKFTKEDNIVIYKYEKVNGRIVVEYKDPDGNVIRKETVITGKVDDPYKVERLEIEGYELIEVIGNEEGVYMIEDQRVTFRYKKIEEAVIPKTGQDRIIFVILGIVIFISLSGLSYFNVANNNKKNNNK